MTPAEAAKVGDAELFAAACSGSEAAFAELYKRHKNAVYRFALYLAGPAVAEEVLQEVFLRLLAGKIRFNASRGEVIALLLGVARRVVLSRLRRERFLWVSHSVRGERNGSSGPVSTGDLLEEVARHEKLAELHRAVRGLPLHYREVIVLCELEEKSYAEAAAVLGCPPGTVRSRLNRARALLAKRLSQRHAAHWKLGAEEGAS